MSYLLAAEERDRKQRRKQQNISLIMQALSQFGSTMMQLRNQNLQQQQFDANVVLQKDRDAQAAARHQVEMDLRRSQEENRQRQFDAERGDTQAWRNMQLADKAAEREQEAALKREQMKNNLDVADKYGNRGQTSSGTLGDREGMYYIRKYGSVDAALQAIQTERDALPKDVFGGPADEVKAKALEDRMEKIMAASEFMRMRGNQGAQGSAAGTMGALLQGQQGPPPPGTGGAGAAAGAGMMGPPEPGPMDQQWQMGPLMGNQGPPQMLPGTKVFEMLPALKQAALQGDPTAWAMLRNLFPTVGPRIQDVQGALPTPRRIGGFGSSTDPRGY